MKPNVAAYLKFRFEKVRLLKQSPKGEVWLALNKQTNEPVIMKIVNYAGLPYSALKNNSHALFAKIFYCAESETDTVVVEEFIQGENLSARQNLPENLARQILLQMCDGLKFLHGLGIIHRDIKPANMILQGGGIVRLIDFDAARTVKENQRTDTKFLGTRGYAPPEQYGFGQTDARSDIYSLGRTMLELTGENCGARLKKILQKCVEVDPKNRWQSADELRAALLKNDSAAWKICATLIIAAGIILSPNSTNEPEFTEPTPEIETAPEIIESPPQIETAPEIIETPPQIETAPEIETEPEIIETPPEIIESPPQIETAPEIIETPPQIETAPEIIESPPQIETAPEITEPEPEVTIENFQPSFATEGVTLENFKPSFPKPPQFNP